MIPNFKMIGVAGLLAATVGFASGVYVRDAFCDAAAAKREVALYTAQINTLKETIERQRKAIEEDASKSASAAAQIEQLERKVREAEKRVSTGKCLPASDVDRVRDLWNNPRKG